MDTNLANELTERRDIGIINDVSTQCPPPATTASVASPLAAYLAQAGWNPRELARQINAWFDRCGQPSQRIHPTAAYSWIKKGFCPYQATADAAAMVLSHHLGRNITADQLWPDRATVGHRSATATDELSSTWSLPHSISHLSTLVQADPTTVQAIRPSSAPEVLATALASITHQPTSLQEVTGAERVLPPMMELLESHIANLRRLDDLQGGGALSLHYVSGELAALLTLLTKASYSRAVGRRLHQAAANLAQLAGWMHFDAGSLGAAQRYFLLGLRVGGAQLDSDAQANILGMLSYMCAHEGDHSTAIELALAAHHRSGSTSPLMRARIAGRLASAYAAAGQLAPFRQHAEQARHWYERRHQDAAPASLYYLSTEQLDAESGLGLVQLAAIQPRHRRALLQEAQQQLQALASTDLEGGYQRSALLHGTFLAQAQRQTGAIDACAQTILLATQRLPVVQSRRCRALLRQVSDDLARMLSYHPPRGKAAGRPQALIPSQQCVVPQLSHAEGRQQFFSTVSAALGPDSVPAGGFA